MSGKHHMNLRSLDLFLRFNKMEMGLGSQQASMSQLKEALSRLSASAIFCLVILMPVVMSSLQVVLASVQLS